MANLKWVTLCVECQQEVDADDMNAHLDANPTHHFVESVRNADTTTFPEAVAKDVLPPATKQMTEELTAVDSNTGEVVVTPAPSWIPLCYQESSLRKDDWAQIGDASDSTAAYALPFDVSLMSLTLTYKRVKSSSQRLLVYVGESEVWTSPVIPKDGSDNVLSFSMNVPVAAGQRVRVKTSNTYYGVIDKAVITILAST